MDDNVMTTPDICNLIATHRVNKSIMALIYPKIEAMPITMGDSPNSLAEQKIINTHFPLY